MLKYHIMDKFIQGGIFLKSLLFFILFGLVLVSPPHASGEEYKGTHLPSLISSLRVSAPLSFCGEKVPIEIQDSKELLEKELLLTLWNRPQVMLWLKRSRRYLPIIEKLLRENNLPDDLKYLAIAESALSPHVSSKRGAIGFWQFMRETGLRYGLTINEHSAEKFGVSLASLLIWNKLDPTAHICPGDRLIIYNRTANNLNAHDTRAPESQ
jgi:membrane-bound lytic murein transglycosylase D